MILKGKRMWKGMLIDTEDEVQARVEMFLDGLMKERANLDYFHLDKTLLSKVARSSEVSKRLAGKVFAKLKGLPDLIIIYKTSAGSRVLPLELKALDGHATKKQKEKGATIGTVFAWGYEQAVTEIWKFIFDCDNP